MTSRMLLVDYGGVMGAHHQEPAESQLAGLLGVDVSRCRELISERSEHGRLFREDKITEAEFWNRVARLAGLSKRSSDEVLSRLWSETYRLDEQVVSLLQTIRRHAPVGVLTNIDRVRSQYLIEVVGIERLADIFLPSYRFRSTKPAADIWRAADETIRAKFGPVEITYVDDRTGHIMACQSAGWQGLLYENPRQLAEALNVHGFLSGKR